MVRNSSLRWCHWAQIWMDGGKGQHSRLREQSARTQPRGRTTLSLFEEQQESQCDCDIVSKRKVWQEMMSKSWPRSRLCEPQRDLIYPECELELRGVSSGREVVWFIVERLTWLLWKERFWVWGETRWWCPYWSVCGKRWEYPIQDLQWRPNSWSRDSL